MIYVATSYTIKVKNVNLTKKCRTPNWRFGASGGVARPTLCVEQLLPLSSKPQWNPPPVAKPQGRCAQPPSVQRATENKETKIINDNRKLDYDRTLQRYNIHIN